MPLVPVDHVAFQARLQPDRLAMTDLATGRRWSYAELDQAVARCAAVLATRYGCCAGDRVASLAHNRPELLMLHLACARIGAIYVPISWRLSPAEIQVLVADAQPQLLVGDGELARAGMEGVGLDVLTQAIAQAPPLPPSPGDPDRPSLILYTSGTSGRSKGVMLSERNLAQTALNFTLLGRVTGESVFLVDSPMFHILGIVTNIRPAMMCGATILVSDGFDPARTLARMADPALKVTHYFGVPQMAARLRAEPGFDPERLRRLTAIFTGGAPHPAADIRRWVEDGIPIVDGFGMSEAGTVFGMPLDLNQIAKKAGSVGLGLPAVGARIVDGQGRDCPPGVAGELLLRGDNVFSGYWRLPAETASAFTADGWFITGDIATCDNDGYFTIVDRKKDMFISGGENIYPAEIEAALAGFPGLVEFAAVGLPDPQWGEVGHLAVVAAPGVRVEESAIRAALSERIARYKLPKHVSLVEALPRTGSGKVQKVLLRALLQERPA